MERRREPVVALLMLWVAAAIYFGAMSLAPREGSDDLDALPVPVKPGGPDGVPNFQRVADDLYRGGQPSLAGFRYLKSLGVKTIINLRHTSSDRYMLEKVPGLAYEHIDIKSWNLYEGHVRAFLELATDRRRTPVFVHCHDGIGRTGVLCAMYRIVVCGWSSDDAVREMRDFGPWDARAFNKMLARMEAMDVEGMRKSLREKR